MRKEIVDFVKKACKTYGFEAIYIPDNDVYSLMYKGRAIQNFDTVQFYQYPRAQRMREYGIFLHYALPQNLGESYKDQFFLHRKYGIKIA